MLFRCADEMGYLVRLIFLLGISLVRTAIFSHSSRLPLFVVVGKHLKFRLTQASRYHILVDLLEKSGKLGDMVFGLL